MRRAMAFAVGLLVAPLGPSGARAQEPPSTPRNVSASGYATTDQPFQPRTGFSAEGELGVFMTLGGRNANDRVGGFPARTTSNANPYLAVIFGYDVLTGDRFALRVGPKFGAAFNGGAARLTAADVATVTPDGAATFANDYAAYEAGLNASLVYMLTERLSFTGKLNGGAVFVDPNPNVDYCGRDASSGGPSPVLQGGANGPTDQEIEDFRAACGDTGAGNAAVGGLFGVSAGIEWFTLMDGFSVGLQVRFQGMVVGGLIPALAIPATLRYTF